jgi:hypothetical protein
MNLCTSFTIGYELGRYDTIVFGVDPIRPTDIIRINPNDCGDCKVSLLDRCKVLVQTIRNLLLKTIDDNVCANVHFLFYGSDSHQKAAAALAPATIKIRAGVNSPTDVELDDDIKDFTFHNLDDFEVALHDVALKKADEITPSLIQCNAINSAKDPKKRKRCSQARKKGSQLCHRHFKSNLAGKALVLVGN